MDLWQQQRRQPVQGDMYAERSFAASGVTFGNKSHTEQLPV